jgi:hypothetical protein
VVDVVVGNVDVGNVDVDVDVDVDNVGVSLPLIKTEAIVVDSSRLKILNNTVTHIQPIMKR